MEPTRKKIKNFELSEVVSMLHDPISGLSVQDRKYLFKTYKDCFVGNEAVQWFIDNGLAFDKSDAIDVGNTLMSYGIFHHVTREHPFEDKYLFYRFSDENLNLISTESEKDKNVVVKKKVIIIGGGVAGCHVAHALQYTFDVTLIDVKDYFECTPAVPKILVQPSQMGNMQVLHKKHLKNINFIHSRVKTLTESPERVILLDGTELFFDYLMICSGSSYTPPIKVSIGDNNKKSLTEDIKESTTIEVQENELETLESRQNLIIKSSKELKSAKTVLVVGGGPVGVEIASEILSTYPEKKLTLVTNASALLDRLPRNAQIKAQEKLTKLGATIIYNEKVNSEYFEELNVYKTNKGTIISADLVLRMIGIIPNSEFMIEYFKEYLNNKGQIKVNKYLQLENYKHIFVLGDVTDVQEEKMAMTAAAQAKIAIININNIENKRPLVPYTSPTPMMLVSLGPNDAVSVVGNTTYSSPGFILGKMKNTLNKFEVHEVTGCFEDQPNKKCFTCSIATKFTP